jgi:hypothetical protein
MNTVGSWHFDKREHDPKPIPRGMRYPAPNVNCDLGRELVRCVLSSFTQNPDPGRPQKISKLTWCQAFEEKHAENSSFSPWPVLHIINADDR